MPTVSVVIPVHDGAAFIDMALMSVADQIRQPDEVVIVDDLSTDDTVTRVQRWANRLPVRLLVNAENVGCGVSRSRAIDAATSDIVAPLDADDVWLPDHLATLVPLAVDERTIVATRTRWWRPDLADHTDTGCRLPPVPPPPRQPVEILRHNFLFSGSLAWRAPIVECANVGRMRHSDDWERWIRLIVLAGCQAVAAPTPTVRYRRHTRSGSAGEAGLAWDIDLLERLAVDNAFLGYRSVLRASVRHRLARRDLLVAMQHADAGHRAQARRHHLAVLRQSPSLRGGLAPGADGSVALRALAGLAAPVSVARRRRLETP